jgi:N-formylglutamate amidohydrolase
MFEDPSPGWFSQRSPRVEAGLGCIPRVAFNGAQIYDRRLKREEADSRLEQVYRPYHRALEALLRRAQAMFGQAWLIDCHSMPAETEVGARAPDVVIGDRFGASCASGLPDLVEKMFRDRGYTTARNSPYAGGFATLAHGQPALGRHALQIEVRRRLYLNEATVEPHDGFLTLRRHMGEIAQEICALTRAEVGLNAENTKKKAASDTDAAKGLGRKRP